MMIKDHYINTISLKYNWLFLFLLVSNLYSQEKQDYEWLFINLSSNANGYIVSTRFKFSEGSVRLFADTVNYEVSRNNASVSDKNGNLLFYTNGCQVLQADHEMMENGDSLNYGKYYVEWWGNCNGGYNGWQDIIILDDPANDFGYYIVHKPFNFSTNDTLLFWIDDIRYSYVDMSYNGGKGKVTKKNIIFHDTDRLVSSYLSAIHHANGRDWWLIQFQDRGDQYYKYLIDENGIALKDSQSFGISTTLNTSAGGFAKFSPNGKHWAWFAHENGLYLFDFDRESGTLSNLRIANHDHKVITFTGLEFSPNSRFVYLSLGDTLLQVDTWKENLNDGVAFIDSYIDSPYILPENFWAMNLAPDCKIYMKSTNSNVTLSVIEYLNNKGKACGFNQHTVPLFYDSSIGMPNFARLRVDEEDVCDSVELYTDVVDAVLQKSTLKIFPNPIYDIAKVESETNGTLYLYDLRGTLIKKQKVHQGDNYLDMEAFVSGMYLVRFVDEWGLSVTKKIIKISAKQD